MSLLQSLLKTYDYAEQLNLVGICSDSSSACIVPIYHDSFSSSKYKVYEILLDENGNYISGDFLPPGEFLIFPVTTKSASRTQNKEPRPLCDKLFYMLNDVKSCEFSPTYENYIDGCYQYLVENKVKCPSYRAIYKYLKKKSLKSDIIKEIGENPDTKIDNDNIMIKRKKIDINKLFISFAVRTKERGVITTSRDVELHRLYINYLKSLDETDQEICDVSGTKMPCITKHKSLFDTRKLISSNIDWFYKGRFNKENQIFHIGVEVSQKIHNLLAYLINNRCYNWQISESASVLSWMTTDLSRDSRILWQDHIIENQGELLDSDLDYSDIDDFLGGKRAQKINSYFSGQKFLKQGFYDENFCILFLETNSKGRVSVRHFEKFKQAEANFNIQKWYVDLAVRKKDKKENKMINVAPSIEKLVTFLYGRLQSEKEINSSNDIFTLKSDAIKKNFIERFLICLIRRQKMPDDIVQRATNNLFNRYVYGKYWNEALWRGVSIIKKHKIDIGELKVGKKGELIMEESRSFLYGRLVAIYEKIEKEAVYVSGNDLKAKTNVETYWQMIRIRPLRLVNILADRILPYRETLIKKGREKRVFYFDNLLTEIYAKLYEIEKNLSNIQSERVGDDFIFGYHIQRQELYLKKQNNDKEEEYVDLEESK